MTTDTNDVATFAGLGRCLAAAGAAARCRPLRLRPPARQPELDTGDTAWMLTSTALVLMMTIPGLALFYGGMVRKKNVLATVMQSFAITCLVTVLWIVVGYSPRLHRRRQRRAYIGGFEPLLPARHDRRHASARWPATIPESSS